MLLSPPEDEGRPAAGSLVDERSPWRGPGAGPYPPLPERLAEDRALAVVRAAGIPDARRLVEALRTGGLRTIELTMTVPDALDHLQEVADTAGVDVGMGTVITGDEARAAVDAGARFLVSPAVRPDVARIAHRAAVAVYLGAFTATEVAQALDVGATAVKLFPAGRLGPRYVTDLLGPYPDLSLLPSGSITHENAPEFLLAGARAVCAGTSVVPPAAVADERYDEITDRAQRFVDALRGSGESVESPTRSLSGR